MKKFIKTLTLGLILTTAVFAQSPGRLDFTVTSANIPGKYAQRHCIAIWVEDANGAYINSMAVYGNSRLKYLTSWKGSSKGVKADAVTGATLKGFRAYNVTWNLKDYAGNSVPNGTYKIWMEATCRNSAGVKYSIDVVVGDNSYVSNPTGNSNYKNMKVTFTATDHTPVSDIEGASSIKLFPNPTLGELTLELFQAEKDFIQIELIDMAGNACGDLYSGELVAGINSLKMDIDKSLAKGNYVVSAQTNHYAWSQKIVLE